MPAEITISPLDERVRTELLPDLEVLRSLGIGTSADVYLAREKSLQRLVAVKVLRPSVAADDVLRRRFEREAQSAARIVHAHVTAIYRVGHLSDGVPYIVMEYIEGRTLADIIESGVGVEPGQSRAMLCAIASALAAAHERGIFVIPIYKSTHERADSLQSDYANMSIFYRDHVTMWVKDYRRTLDYLSSRTEFDREKFAYMGFSWGGLHGAMVPAIEKCIKTSVLYVAGLMMERARPEADAFNFLPRVTSPVLMLNGRYDYFFPLETSQRPFFARLGTPAADKKQLIYEGGHDVPRTELIKESLSWFDKYLGPVRQ